VFTARYALSPYIKQTHFVFKGLKDQEVQDPRNGTDGCPETSVNDYHSALRTIPEEQRSH
jgi:hypothetical protein